MTKTEQYDAVVMGSGEGGKYLAWHLAEAGQRTGVVERRWIGGSCPNINCLPSKNEIWSAGVAHTVSRAGAFGVSTGRVTVDMAKVGAAPLHGDSRCHLDASDNGGRLEHAVWQRAARRVLRSASHAC